MGFHVEINSILRTDEPYQLARGSEHDFEKTGSRVFFDTLPIWLTSSDWTARAEIRVLSQTRTPTSVKGRFLVLHFDAAGTVINRAVLGESAAVLENPAGCWHAVLSLDGGGVIFEVKHGPYMAIDAGDFAAWSPAADSADAIRLNNWYAIAQIGDRFSG